MKKFYMNLELEVDKIILRYKDEIILIINKEEICPDTNTSHN